MSPEPLAKGARRYHLVGKYQVLAHIATGGMGVVYRAQDTETGQDVALKILSPTLAANPSALERFRREARHGARMRHENVAAIHEFGEANGTFFLAMEFVEGIDLQEYVHRQGFLDPEEAVALLTQAARALHCLHEHQIVHRDIKPANFLITQVNEQPILKLTDLGVARELSDDELRVTQYGKTVGTIDYLAPEQARDSSWADVRSDIYSLGCTFYYMLTGRLVFPEGGLTERLYAHSEAEPPDPRQFNPATRLRVVSVLRRMLAKKPQDRYQTPTDLLRDLARLENSTGQPEPVEEEGAIGGSWAGPSAKGGAAPAPSSASPDSGPTDLTIPVAATTPTIPDRRQIALGQFERANQALAQGNHEYALHLLLSCCELEPSNLVYRQALRRLEPAWSQHRSGSNPLTWFTGWLARTRLKAARQVGDYLKVLAYGEKILTRNPGDLSVQMDMAEAARALGLIDLAIWLLEQAWQRDSHTPLLNRALAQLYEVRGNYPQATTLWNLVLKADPTDLEAHQKLQDLAAKETIVRGQYEEIVQAKR
jgi:serine/threonine protein kinase